MTPGTPHKRRLPRTCVAGWLRGCALLVVLVATLGPSVTHAHPLSPPHVRIIASPQREADGLRALVVTIRHAEDARPPRLTLPKGCRVASQVPARDADGDHRIDAVWRCEEALGALEVDAAFGDPPVIVETGVGPTDGTSLAQSHLLDASTPRLALDTVFGPPPSLLAHLAAWGRTGAVHLLIGADHVLLVLGLVLLLGIGRRLVVVLTAFTVGHSISLALGVTGTVALPAAPVETAIALTLVALALALVHPRPSTRPAPGPTFTIGVGLGVGLLHGLGFAGVMQALDPGRDGLLVPLAGFNVGLEVAQLALVLAMGLVLALAKRVAPRAIPRLNVVAGWTIGVVAAAWTLERLAS